MQYEVFKKGRFNYAYRGSMNATTPQGAARAACKLFGDGTYRVRPNHSLQPSIKYVVKRKSRSTQPVINDVVTRAYD